MFGVESASLAVAVSAGMIAAVNPCGFALLPAYLSLFVAGKERLAPAPAVVCALRASVAVTIGFTGVFLAFGLAIAPVALVVQEFVPPVTIVLGIAVALVGALAFVGRTLPTLTIRRSNRGPAKPLAARWPAMIGFGASYGFASIGCTLAPFLVVVITALQAGPPVAGLALFVAYALGMGATISVASTAAALARSGMIDSLRRASRVAPRLGALALVLAGTYVAWYGLWEWRVVYGDAGADPIISAGERIELMLSNGISGLGLAGAAIILGLLAAIAIKQTTRLKRAEQRGDRPQRPT